jgi:uncharacterized membrane protein
MYVIYAAMSWIWHKMSSQARVLDTNVICRGFLMFNALRSNDIAFCIY